MPSDWPSRAAATDDDLAIEDSRCGSVRMRAWGGLRHSQQMRAGRGEKAA
jgi:hypothetical protein